MAHQVLGHRRLRDLDAQLVQLPVNARRAPEGPPTRRYSPSPWRDGGSAAGRPLTEALEFFQGEAELAEDLVEEWRSDLSATMDGNRHGPAIGVVPALVASGLSTPYEADLTGHPLELPRGGARHSTISVVSSGSGVPRS